MKLIDKILKYFYYIYLLIKINDLIQIFSAEIV